MSIDDLIDFLDSLDGVLSLQPGPGDGSPIISWGDVFFYYAPEGIRDRDWTASAPSG